MFAIPYRDGFFILQTIQKYFPHLTSKQLTQFDQLLNLYAEWNSKINVISRKDMDCFYIHHVLHSLAIAKVLQFKQGSKVLDVGTGGGFPGIPLAIMFPETQFTLVDSIGKKIKVVNAVAESIGVTNALGIHERAEKINDKFDFVISRAVTSMPEFILWVKTKFISQNNHPLKNGILYLKGGDLRDEFLPVLQPLIQYPIANFFNDSFFETKKVVYVQMNS